jgi:NADPH:quinone reductase-like Zn-dependent oxidoreductase
VRYLHRGWYPSVNVQALFDLAALASGQTVLVNGAGGAVGGYVVQLAKQLGAVVTATASPRNADAGRLRAKTIVIRA